MNFSNFFSSVATKLKTAVAEEQKNLKTFLHSAPQEQVKMTSAFLTVLKGEEGNQDSPMVGYPDRRPEDSGKSEE